VDDRLCRVVAARLPGLALERVRRLGEGQENVAYEVDGRLIVRFSRNADRLVVEREAALLAAIGKVSPLPVPVPVFVDRGEGCLAYHRLPGVPLLELGPSMQQKFALNTASRLGELLAAVHAIPVRELAALVELDTQPLPGWLADAQDEYVAVVDHVPAEHKPTIEAFLTTPPPAQSGNIVVSHNDLGIEHVLVDPERGEIGGVIDWSDAAVTDPAYDLGLILRDLGPAALDAALASYTRPEAGLPERAAFYARCSVLEDLRYGVEAGRPEYAEKSLRSLAWLFPPAGGP
jgi:aminoglycoside phosphotransferase (APT) family kinase protein